MANKSLFSYTARVRTLGINEYVLYAPMNSISSALLSTYSYNSSIMILHRISQYIDNENLFKKTDKILVALSGGADSVALLRLLTQLGYYWRSGTLQLPLARCRIRP